MEVEKLPRLLGGPAVWVKQAFKPPKSDPLPELPSTPDCFPAEDRVPSNYEVPPEKWAMTVSQWNEFVQCCKSTDRWRTLERRSGYVSAHDACNYFVKPWTRGTGRGVALNMNSAAPIEAQLMLSHTWAEDLTECAEALNTHCRRNKLMASTSVWFCLFSNYQAGDEDGDIGPTVAEQLAMDPFGHVIRSAREQCGMLVIHTSRAEVYERLWCVYEIATALREDCMTRSACSQKYADTGRRRLQDVLDVNTESAKCSSTVDEDFICDRVNTSGGFERLDKEIFQFRVSMLLEQAEEAGHNRLQSLTKAITKVEKRLDLDNSSSSSSGSWVSKLRAYWGLWLMLAFLALGGVAVAAFATYQRSQDILSDVETAPAVVTATVTTTVSVTTAATATVTTTTAATVTTTTQWWNDPWWITDITVPSPAPTPAPIAPDNETTVPPPPPDPSPTPPGYPTSSTATSTSPDSTSPAGGQSTTDADEQEQSPGDVTSPLVHRVILISGAAAMSVLLVLLILLTKRLGCRPRQAGDAERGTAGRQNSRHVRLERLEFVRQAVEARAQELDRHTGDEAV